MAKAKTYGGRWRLTGKQIGKGGQSEVFGVVDTSGQLSGEFALKRVLNPKRHHRFVSEIEAIKTLDHPNVIKLIDHSILSSPGVVPEKQYLVMPIAEDGDLSKDK